MKRSSAVIIGLSLAVWLLSETSARAGDKAVVFETDIVPIFKSRCWKCHGEGKVRGGLDLRGMGPLTKAGDSGPTISRDKPAESLLLKKIESGEMPPPKEGKLDKKQHELLRRWVLAGAPAANPASPAAVEETVSRVTKEERDFWAFQPPKRAAVAKVSASQRGAGRRVRTPIDAFLLACLETKGLSFNADTSKEVSLRRLCFDLLGLPPTPEQRNEFLNDRRSDAYERLVDRLLAAPAFGERWGRHWLDLAGYADSDGYLAADRLRPEAWRYRDYVINAYNDDLPYDQFVTEQLAGDQLSDWQRAEKLTPLMIRQLTATGFLRTASDPTYPGYTEPNEIHQVISDTMQIVGSTFLGVTIQCARCHAHKLEPISQHDYYSLKAVLLPALDPARWQPSEVRGIPMATESERVQIRAHNQKVNEKINQLNGELADLTVGFGKKFAAEKARPAVKKGAVKDPTKELAGRYPDFKAAADKLNAAIAAQKARVKKDPPVVLRGLMDVDGKCPEGRVLRRGDYNKPGKVVQPGVPEVLVPAGFKLTSTEGYKSSGRRLALAKWLTEPNHPLTARVHVNRMWAHLFGRGIVPTVANVGKSGARPSHPELLDWLATEFIRAGWSQKSMIRQMVTSTAYRQTSQVDSIRSKLDPGNELLSSWRSRRLTGEVLRDSILAVSGKLNGERLGPPSPVTPKADGSVETGDDAKGNRRSIYVIVRRSQHLTLLDLFDTPMMEVNCPERNVSTVPLQALAMLHGPFAERNAAALADRIVHSAPADDVGRVGVAYRLLLGREPRASEVGMVQKFVSAVVQEQAGSVPAGEARHAQAVRTAWTQAALVLLNSNEFLYVH